MSLKDWNTSHEGVAHEQLSEGKIVMWDSDCENMDETALVYEPHTDEAESLTEIVN